MPRPAPTLNPIPAMYKESFLNISLFAYVRGVRSALHTVTVSSAVDMFIEGYGLDRDIYDKASAITTYNRMQNKFITLLKSNK